MADVSKIKIDSTTYDIKDTPARDGVGAVANRGAKNLLRFDLESVKALNGGTWSGNANTINGVTTTVNDTDKTISFVKTASGGDVYFRLTTALQSILSSGSKYILSGATGGSSTTFYLGNSGNWENMNGDTEITYTGSFASIYVCVKSTMPLNTTITIKPMIRPASITDATFQPYALPNPVLTPALIEQVDAGAKNRFLYDKAVGTTETIHGRTFTIQPDGGIKIETTGTVDADADFYMLGNWSNRSTLFDAGSKTWIPSCGCMTKSDNISLRIYNRSTGSTIASRTITSDDNAGLPFDFDLTCAFIKIGSAQTIPSGGIIVYPMICTVEDYAISQAFVPYRPSWQEMYEMIQALQGTRSSSTQSLSPSSLKMGSLTDDIDVTPEPDTMVTDEIKDAGEGDTR